ncbi:MAG: EF-P lysine aminoacylase EpmA [Desulfobacterium sp.]|nr:EF-P lysine aminoacylase EpmA [Desulfobacterium sp.]
MDNLKQRDGIIRAMRNYFYGEGFLEVETPIRIPAPAPEAHIDSFESDGWFLQSSPELAMKRLLSRGHSRIFQICKCFRRDERGSLHLTEMTMLEWYITGCTYLNLMEQCRGLIRHIARETGCGHSLKYQGKTIDIGSSWEKITVKEAFKRYTSSTMERAMADDRFDEIIAFEIEPELGIKVPTLIIDFPAPMAALARLKPDDPKFAERFELYIGGIELANGFSELVDPVEQRTRFEQATKIRTLLNKPATPMPEPFLRDLKNMPQAAGIALGVDRLVMLFTDCAEIDQVVAFTPENL